MPQEKRARRGRPPVPAGEKVIQLSVGVRRRDVEALRRISDARNVSVSAIVQGLVSRYVKRRGKET